MDSDHYYRLQNALTEATRDYDLVLKERDQDGIPYSPEHVNKFRSVYLAAITAVSTYHLSRRSGL